MLLAQLRQCLLARAVAARGRRLAYRARRALRRLLGRLRACIGEHHAAQVRRMRAAPGVADARAERVADVQRRSEAKAPDELVQVLDEKARPVSLARPCAFAVAAQVREEHVVSEAEREERGVFPLAGAAPLTVEEEDRRPLRRLAR